MCAFRSACVSSMPRAGCWAEGSARRLGALVPSAPMRNYRRLSRLPLLLLVFTFAFGLAAAVSRADGDKPGAIVVLKRTDAAATPAAPAPAAAAADQADPYLWLEDIDGERAMEWVRARNAATAKKLESQP